MPGLWERENMYNTLIVVDECTEFTMPQLMFFNESHSQINVGCKPISIRAHQDRLASDIASKELSVLQILKIKNVLKQGKPTGFKTNG